MCHKLSYRCKKRIRTSRGHETKEDCIQYFFPVFVPLSVFWTFNRLSAKAYFLFNIHSAISLVLCQIKGLIDMIKHTNVIDPNSSQPVIKRTIFVIEIR